MAKTQKQIRKELFFYLLLLIVLIATAYLLAKYYGLGKIDKEFYGEEATEILKKFIPYASNLSDKDKIKCYEYSGLNIQRISFAFTFNVNDIEIKKIINTLNLQNGLINNSIIRQFQGFNSPGWWTPGNVQSGFFYENENKKYSLKMLYDKKKASVYLLINPKTKEK